MLQKGMKRGGFFAKSRSKRGGLGRAKYCLDAEILII